MSDFGTLQDFGGELLWGDVLPERKQLFWSLTDNS